MATDPRIRNDLSIGIETRASQRAEEQRARIVPNSRQGSITQQVAQYQRNMAAPGTVLKYPQDTPKYYMVMKIADYSRTDFLNINFQTKETLILPLPTQIADRNEVSWQEYELGPLVGTLGNQVVNSVTGSGNGWGPVAAAAIMGGGVLAGQTGVGAFNSIRQKRIENSMKLAQARENKATAGIFNTAGGQAWDMFRAAAGFSPNQWLTVLLKGPRYKRYTYTWFLVPKNMEEAVVINHMVKTIQNAKCPELGIANAYWKFPSIFQLQFKPNEKYLFQFKPSVIESCDVNYSTGHDHAFYHGNNGENPPEAVRLSISFLELEYWRKNQYLEGL